MMKFVSKTPLRVSFFGGGTDYPDYLEQFPGAVLGTTIDQFIYIFVLPMSGISQKKYKLSYRMTEEVDTPADFSHPVVRAILTDCNWDRPINIATMSDLPGGTGLGSSSAFTVGFLNVIKSMSNESISRQALALEAIRIEHDVLKENVGVQDQIHAAFGGLSLYHLEGSRFKIEPVLLHQEVKDALNTAILLVYTGGVRSASMILEEQMKNSKEKKIIKELDHLSALAYEAEQVFRKNDPDIVLNEIGLMLSDGWKTKRALASAISNTNVDEIYNIGMELGAFGGKLCGAGGGGFFMFLVDRKHQPKFIEAFGENNVVQVKTTDYGSQVSTII